MDSLHSWDMAYVTQQKMVVRMVAAALLGGLIGLDREMGGKAMGLRTLILVATGSVLLTLLEVRGRWDFPISIRRKSFRASSPGSA